MRPSPNDLARQVARWLAAPVGRMGYGSALTFAEPASATPANIYAAPLPTRAHRLLPSVGVEIVAASGPGGLASSSPVTRHVLDIHSRAATPGAAMDVLATFRLLARSSNEGAWYDALRLGLIGLPPAATAPADDSPVDVWRVIGMEVISEPQPSGPDDPGADGSRTREGEFAAEMTLAVSAVPARVARAFTATCAAGGGRTAATIDIDAGSTTLTLAVSPGTSGDASIVLGAARTIAQAHADINTAGGGWSAASLNALASGLPASRLLGVPAADALGLTLTILARLE